MVLNFKKSVANNAYSKGEGMFFYYLFFCQGNLPSNSTCKEVLKIVRTSTISPKIVTDLKVGSVETVKIISAAIRTSNPNRIDFPIVCLSFSN